MFDGIELQPEHEVLHKELSTKRKDLLEELQGRALKSVRIFDSLPCPLVRPSQIVVEMASRVARMHKDDDPEKIMLKRAVTDLRKLIAEQGTFATFPSSQQPLNDVGILLDKLDADLALYRKAFNQRILYFRQLQEISDSVSDAVFENTLAEALQECAAEQRDLTAKVGTTLSTSLCNNSLIAAF